jgi:hypothetical protein
MQLREIRGIHHFVPPHKADRVAYQERYKRVLEQTEALIQTLVELQEDPPTDADADADVGKQGGAQKQAREALFHLLGSVDVETYLDIVLDVIHIACHNGSLLQQLKAIDAGMCVSVFVCSWVQNSK